MTYIPLDQVNWKKVKILKSSSNGPLPHPYDYEFWLPEPLASWDVFDYWEKERFYSMRDNLHKGDVLFDVGTEQGWCNLIYAQFVDPENMVLIEPTPDFWPNIKQTWEKNYDKKPLAFFEGLFSETTNEKMMSKDKSLYLDKNYWREWPKNSSGDVIDKNKYQYIHEHEVDVPEVTIDDYVKYVQVVPDAITIDVEGAEFLVLKGAEETLKNHHPKVWVSIHPDLGLRDYNLNPMELMEFMYSFGYKSEFLGVDHEEHHYFEYKHD